MLPILNRRPELRCQAHSRRSGWLQCGRLAAYGGKTCTSHGARKKNRWGKDAPNYRHGNRTLEFTTNVTHALQRLRVLAMAVKGMSGDNRAAAAFWTAWGPLLEQQHKELVALREKTARKRRG